MLKIWYMMTIKGQTGPLELQDLVKIISMAPDTLVRKTDEQNWTPAYKHPDLKVYFKPVKPRAVDEKAEQEKEENKDCSDVLVASSHSSMPPGLERCLTWIMMAILVFLIVKSFSR